MLANKITLTVDFGLFAVVTNRYKVLVRNHLRNLITKWDRSRLGKAVVHPKDRCITHHSTQCSAWPEYLQSHPKNITFTAKKREYLASCLNNTWHAVWTSEVKLTAVHPCTDPHCLGQPGGQTGGERHISRKTHLNPTNDVLLTLVDWHRVQGLL